MVTKAKGKAHNPKGVQGTPSEDEWKKIRKFGQIVKKERNKRGWTLEDMELQGWKSWQHWQYIEAGKRNITFATILRISNVLKVHPKELWDQL
jgi:ribosome-binding protein aMBF1 (putative translation factor)